MATVNYSIVSLPQSGGYIGVRVWRWTPLTQTDTSGNDLDQPNFTDRAVQVSGTFGGASVSLEGTINGTDYHTLTDPQGNALTFSDAGLKQISEAVLKMHPVLTGGNGSTDLTVTVLMKGN